MPNTNKYYIAFNQADSQGNVIAYGYNPNPTGDSVSGISPLGSEETLADFESYQSRLAELGFVVTVDPATEIPQVQPEPQPE